MIVHALDPLCLQFGFTEGREKQRREDRDDRNYHQQLDESKTSAKQARDQKPASAGFHAGAAI